MGKIARVTGRIEPGVIGEVMVFVAGGTSALHAYAVDPTCTFAVGAQVLVVEFRSPQTVYVEALPPFLRGD